MICCNHVAVNETVLCVKWRAAVFPVLEYWLNVSLSVKCFGMFEGCEGDSGGASLGLWCPYSDAGVVSFSATCIRNRTENIF